MKNLKKALIATAVLGGLAGTNAYAGTEACFEVYQGADNAAPLAWEDVYTLASCKEPRGGAAADDLQAIDVSKIAYELTDLLTIDFDDYDNTGAPTGADQHIVYIPTTDIPSGTVITIRLNGATFASDLGQIHLTKVDDAGTGFEAVASTDGMVDNQTEITFLTKAGVTIGAGTRLVFSKVANGAYDSGAGTSEVEPVGIIIDNEGCTDPLSQATVSIEATSARTDGNTGFDIAGGVSSATDLVDIRPQFITFYGAGTVDGEVNAESSDSEGAPVVARTEFVYDASASDDSLTLKRTQIISPAGFINREGELDQFITLDGVDDELLTKFYTSGVNPGATVKAGIFNAQTVATGVVATNIDVADAVTYGDIAVSEATATVYGTDALTLFTPDSTGGDAESIPAAAATLYGALSDWNQTFYVVENRDTTQIMNFNYELMVGHTLDFNNPNYLDHCADTVNTHDIGVNGAVLKVPYAVNGEGNFVRITNEHDAEAEVTVDLFGESDNGESGNRHVVAVSLGKVPAKSSVVYFVPELIEAAEAEGYTGADGGYAAGDLGVNAKSNHLRHTMTFTVNAPRDSVHGVTVQKVIGGVDRVMPVLDLNNWNQ